MAIDCSLQRAEDSDSKITVMLYVHIYNIYRSFILRWHSLSNGISVCHLVLTTRYTGNKINLITFCDYNI